MLATENTPFEVNNRRIAKNTVYLYVRMLLLLLVSLYTARIVLEALGESDYGLYNVVGGIVLLFSVVNGVLSAGTSRFLTYDLGKGDIANLKKTFSAAFTMHLIAALIVLVLCETVGLWFLNTQLVIPEDRLVAANWVFQFSVITAMISLTQVPYSACIISHEQMGIYAWTGIAEGVFKLLTAFYILYANISDKLIVYGLLNLLWSALLQLYYRFYCVRHFIESRLMVVRDKGVYKRMLSFSLWDFGGAMGGTVNTQGMSFLLNIFFGLIANAARGIALQVEAALQKFADSFTTAVRPQIVKSYAAKDYKGFFNLIFESSKYSYFLLMILALPVFLESDTILRIWLLEVPKDTSIFVKCIVATQLFRTMSRPVIDGCHATGNVKYLNLYTSFTILLTLPCGWLAFKLGCPAVSIFLIHGFLRCLCNFVELYALKKEISFSIREYIKKVMLHSLIVTAIVVIVPILVTIIIPPSFTRLCITVLVSLIMVGLGTYWMILKKEYREKLMMVVKTKIRR